MEECCQILVDRLNNVADGQPINIYKYVTLFALDVICGIQLKHLLLSLYKINYINSFISNHIYIETAMGIKVNAQLNEESEFVKMTQL